MRTGKTKSGFEFAIEESSMDNMELVDKLVEIDDGNMAAMPKAATMLLGEEQKERLYAHLRAAAGNVPIEAFINELTEIMEIMGEEGKNSSPSPT